MDFNRTNVAIKLNKHQEPTVYHALCMMEELMADVSGGSLGELPLGDEKAAIMLVRMSRQLLKVYENHSDAFTRAKEQRKVSQRELEKKTNELEKLDQNIQCEKEKNERMDRQLRDRKADLTKLTAAQRELEIQSMEIKDLPMLEINERLAKVSQKLESLVSIRHALVCSMDSLEAKLGTSAPGIFPISDLRSRLNWELEVLQEKIADVQKTLLDCADHLVMED